MQMELELNPEDSDEQTCQELVIDINPGTTRHVLRGFEIKQLKPTNTLKNEHEVLRQGGSNFIVKLSEGTEVSHPEHTRLVLSAGIWTVAVIREYDPFEDAITAVFD
jgi:hypothetical protein